MVRKLLVAAPAVIVAARLDPAAPRAALAYAPDDARLKQNVGLTGRVLTEKID
ncbi:MAG: hypothetical protein VB067_02440 [Christensenellaceae bacterium]|nr:hypothetical protein [Christensenellaceae bacterium]MEA5066556.1 hypothetical protein [Eubacteriales bacterium]MEA5067823.1 hypothetical protein [Christensenellaceae bacterium]